MADDVKLMIDCSKPFGDPEHETYVPLDGEESRQRRRDAEAAAEAEAMRARVFLRLARNQLLEATDYLVAVPDARSLVDPSQPLDEDERKQWLEWRQELRDLPATVESAVEPVWPEPPAPVPLSGAQIEGVTRTPEELVPSASEALSTVATDDKSQEGDA